MMGIAILNRSLWPIDPSPFPSVILLFANRG
jgi:hypothetical protein